MLECWSVALSKASGEGVSGMRALSFSRVCLHLVAMGRSQRDADLSLNLSFAQCSTSVETRLKNSFDLQSKF